MRKPFILLYPPPAVLTSPLDAVDLFDARGECEGQASFSFAGLRPVRISSAELPAWQIFSLRMMFSSFTMQAFGLRFGEPKTNHIMAARAAISGAETQVSVTQRHSSKPVRAISQSRTRRAIEGAGDVRVRWSWECYVKAALDACG